MQVLVKTLTKQVNKLCGGVQCCRAGAAPASSRNFWPEPELQPEYEVSAPGQTKLYILNHTLFHMTEQQASHLHPYSFQKI